MRNKVKTVYVCDPNKNYICSKGKSCQDWCFFTEHVEFMKDGTKGFTSRDPEKRAKAMEAYITSQKDINNWKEVIEKAEKEVIKEDE